ncbi:MAG: KOW domain-containing RNA-binding protein [Oscillospiraceae bacterium]|nr:KOW domain-containing RNA-binding protein [Oscillospiraceae bacterium]
MKLQTGMIVRAIAGKEQDQFLLVTRQDGNFVYLADGKHRKLTQPKRKNPKHVRATGKILTQEEFQSLTDFALRRILRTYRESELQALQALQGGE